MGLIAGSALLIQAARLINDLKKDDRARGYVVVSRDKGRLRTKYRIDYHQSLSREKKATVERKTGNSMETLHSVQVNNPPFVAQKLLERYASRSQLGDWFSLSKRQLQDLEQIIVLIYAASG